MSLPLWLSHLRVSACVSCFQHWVSLSAHRGSTTTTSPRSHKGAVTSDVNTTQRAASWPISFEYNRPSERWRRRCGPELPPETQPLLNTAGVGTVGIDRETGREIIGPFVIRRPCLPSWGVLVGRVGFVFGS